MDALLSVYLFGPEAAARRDAGAIRFARGSEDALERAPAALLNRLAADSTTAFFMFADAARPLDLDDLERGLALLGDESAATAVLLSGNRAAGPYDPWSRFPRRLASLVLPVGRHASVVFRRAAFARTPGFPEVSEPVWDWIMEAAREEHPFSVLDLGPHPEAHPATDDFLPALAPAAPGSERRWLLNRLQDFEVEDVAYEGGAAADRVALKAGLLQWHDFLDESHRLAQSVEGRGRYRAGDYWHGIMHRREPDDSNARYWFRRVGSHPVFPKLAAAAAPILDAAGVGEAWRSRLVAGDAWDPFAFIDCCAAGRQSPESPLAAAAQRIQREEMLLLLEQTFEDACAAAH